MPDLPPDDTVKTPETGAVVVYRPFWVATQAQGADASLPRVPRGDFTAHLAHYFEGFAVKEKALLRLYGRIDAGLKRHYRPSLFNKRMGTDFYMLYSGLCLNGRWQTDFMVFLLKHADIMQAARLRIGTRVQQQTGIRLEHYETPALIRGQMRRRLEQILMRMEALEAVLPAGHKAAAQSHAPFGAGYVMRRLGAAGLSLDGVLPKDAQLQQKESRADNVRPAHTHKAVIIAFRPDR